MMFDDNEDRTNGDGPIFVETQIGTATKDRPDQTAASLLSGILGDLQHLVEQQFELTRREIEDEIRQRAIAAAAFALGVTIFFVGAIVFCFGLSHLLHWATSPGGADPAWLPLWACHTVVAAALALIGGVVAHVGRVKFRSTAPFPNPLSELLQKHAP
jgi:hypothetical protein